MRKVTTPAVICDKCGSMLKSEEYDVFCEHCKMKVIGDAFEISIFWKDGECTDQLDFCSLRHAMEWLSKFPLNKKEVDFITLPYIRDIDDMQKVLNEMMPAGQKE